MFNQKKAIGSGLICLVLALPGCVGKNLSPEQLNAIGELAKIQKVSGCTWLLADGGVTMVAAGLGGVICFGQNEPVTINDAAQLKANVITVRP